MARPARARDRIRDNELGRETKDTFILFHAYNDITEYLFSDFNRII